MRRVKAQKRICKWIETSVRMVVCKYLKISIYSVGYAKVVIKRLWL